MFKSHAFLTRVGNNKNQLNPLIDGACCSSVAHKEPKTSKKISGCAIMRRCISYKLPRAASHRMSPRILTDKVKKNHAVLLLRPYFLSRIHAFLASRPSRYCTMPFSLLVRAASTGFCWLLFNATKSAPASKSSSAISLRPYPAA